MGRCNNSNSEADFTLIPKILRSISDERIHKMQCNGLRIYHQYFMRPGGSMELAFRILKWRIMNHDMYLGKREEFRVLREWPHHSKPQFVNFCIYRGYTYDGLNLGI